MATIQYDYVTTHAPKDPLTHARFFALRASDQERVYKHLRKLREAGIKITLAEWQLALGEVEARRARKQAQ